MVGSYSEQKQPWIVLYFCVSGLKNGGCAVNIAFANGLSSIG
jgi:hypothetical protein